ncbi:MAG: hypothetical protein HGA37_00915 [Lentimicrobium sp.]|nr:hypothetical protein [Lentimicrobium sp.]
MRQTVEVKILLFVKDIGTTYGDELLIGKDAQCFAALTLQKTGVTGFRPEGLRQQNNRVIK